MKSSFLLVVLTTFISGMVGLPATASELREAVDGSSAMCWQGTDRAFTVKECIEDLKTKPAPKLSVGLPASLMQSIGSELLWSPSLLQVLANYGAAEGRFTRTAILDGVVTDMGSHTFSARLRDRNGSVSLSVHLQGHAIQELNASYGTDGSGFVRFRGSGRTRTIEFTKGVPISDSADRQIPTKSQFYMGCFIDTPAWDHYRPNFCAQLGTTPSSASFKFFLPYTPSYFVWYGPAGCSGQTCTVPISPNQVILGGGYWVINNTPTGPVGAEAHYYYEPGF